MTLSQWRAKRLLCGTTLALSAWLASNANASHVPSVGEAAPLYLGYGVDDKRVSLQDYKGKVVVISFWATWCAPCRHELPILENMQIAGNGQIQVVAINTESRDVFDNAAKIMKSLTMKLTHDDNQRGFAAYGVKGLPHLVIIGKDMRIVSVREGYGPKELDAVAAELNAALRVELPGTAAATATTPQ